MSTDCIFCKIASGKIPSDTLFETDRVKVIRDINPHAPIHYLIIPKKHIATIENVAEEDRDLMADMLFAAQEAARQLNTHMDGYKLLFNVQSGGGQMVFHIHLHLLGGWKGEKVEFPPKV